MISLTRELEYDYLKKQSFQGKWLNLGAGKSELSALPLQTADITRADIDPETKPDVVMDATEIFPLPDQHFDGILALNILEHLDYTEHFFRECSRVLKRGGTLFATIPFIYPYHGSDVYGDYIRWTGRKMQIEAQSHFKSVQVEQLGGRYGVISEVTLFTTPVPLRPLHGLYRPIVKWMDNNLILPSERKLGKQFYLVNMIKAIR